MKKPNLFSVLFLLAIQLLFGSTIYSQINDKFITSKQAIPNRYIVILNDDSDALSNFSNNQIGDEKVSKLTRDLSLVYGGNVDRQFSRAIKGYAVNMSRQQAITLSQDSRVKYVEEDFLVTKDDTQTNAPWGLDRIDQRNLPLNTIYNYATNGTGVHAYILDTGIRATHTEFTGRLGNGTDLINDGQNGND